MPGISKFAHVGQVPGTGLMTSIICIVCISTSCDRVGAARLASCSWSVYYYYRYTHSSQRLVKAETGLSTVDHDLLTAVDYLDDICPGYVEVCKNFVSVTSSATGQQQ